MQMYVSVTDQDMFDFLKEKQFTEVNFWRPGAMAFRALYEDELFLFKMHAPANCIVGGGFFCGYAYLPIYMAWEAFGEKCGKLSLVELNQSIRRYRVRQKISDDTNYVGCIVLKDVFYLDEKDYIPAPDDFSASIVQGKLYDSEKGTGKMLYSKLLPLIGDRIKEPHPMGEGAFRILVTKSYRNRCAITGEPTLPVLRAVHIRPVADGGTNTIDNGILMTSDLSALFHYGYITIDTDLKVHVSPRLKSDFGGGDIYERYQNTDLKVIPESFLDFPNPDNLRWHNENVFMKA